MTWEFMTALGLLDKCQAHVPHPWCSKSAAPPKRSALMGRQYVPQHPYKIELVLKHRPECRTQALLDLFRL